MAADTEAQHALVRDLAGAVLATQAPDELPILDLTSEEFFADPDAALAADRRDESLGFGIELAMLTPVVLAVVTPVVQFLVDLARDTFTDAAKQEVTPRVAAWLRRVTHRDDEKPVGPPSAGLTETQARAVHDLAHRRALDLGLDESRAGLLADAVVGGLVVAR